MSTLKTPFRYDFVGSFLRPLSLKEARKQFEAGTISKQELVKVEDACIEDLIAKQKTAGYQCNHRWGISPRNMAFRFLLGVQRSWSHQDKNRIAISW